MSANEYYLDIAPPGAAQRVRERHEEARERRPAKKRRHRDREPREGGRSLFNGKILLVVLGLVIVVVAVLHMTLHRASVTVWPLTEPIVAEAEVRVTPGGDFDFAQLQMPSTELSAERTASQTFPSSFVTQEQTAQGTIRVFNLHSTAPLTLREQTRFLSDDGKLFRTPDRIEIPGKTRDGSDFVPGTLDVKVVAAEPGEDYNITGDTTFSLPGLAGTALYTLVYAETIDGVKGGFSGEGRQVLDDDMDTARDVLISRLEEGARQALEEQTSDAFRLIDDSIEYEVVTETTTADVGDVADEFTLTITLAAKALGVEEDALNVLADKLLTDQLPPQREYWKEGREVTWRVHEGVDEADIVRATLQVSSKAYDVVDEPALIDTLAGESRSGALFLLKNRFDRAEVTLSPFWAQSIPASSSRIDLEIVLD